MQEHYWNTKRGSRSPEAYFGVTCAYCGKHFTRPRWYHKRLEAGNKGRGNFCSPQHALYGRHYSDETRRKISEKQKGIAKIHSGRLGHVVTEETRRKISQAKRGVSCKQDYNLIIQEMQRRGITKYVNTTRRPIPDAIYIENGKLVAVEVEKKPIESDVVRKMDRYSVARNYDKVILVWYLRSGERFKEWQYENGQWRIV